MQEGPAPPERPGAGPFALDRRRALPAVGALLTHANWPPHLPLPKRTLHLRKALNWARQQLSQDGTLPSTEKIMELAMADASTNWPERRRVLNATGLLLHTNLGRAPLAPQALEALTHFGSAYLDLEMDLATNQRGSRHALAAHRLCELTGAQAALVVNNGAAGVLLAATALAQGREVVCSRGELVAIGGGFRVHEVLASAGAKLVEVGATNHTTAKDWQQAIGPHTAALWRSHRSNFRLEGFVDELKREAFVAIAHEAGLPAVEDLGHGLLHPLPQSWGEAESTVQEALQSGMDLVVVSADKLLGGPQAGLVLGKAKWVAHLAQHPLMRALRPDKLCLVALEASLNLWADPAQALSQIPIWRRAMRSQSLLESWASALLPQVRQALPAWEVESKPSHGAMGGGSLPGHRIPSWSLHLHRAGHDPEDLAQALRLGSTAVVGRLEGSALVLDLLALDEADAPSLLAALQAANQTLA